MPNPSGYLSGLEIQSAAHCKHTGNFYSRTLPTKPAGKNDIMICQERKKPRVFHSPTLKSLVYVVTNRGLFFTLTPINGHWSFTQGARGGLTLRDAFLFCTVWRSCREEEKRPDPKEVSPTSLANLPMPLSHTAELSNEPGIPFQMPGGNNETRRDGFKVWKPTGIA